MSRGVHVVLFCNLIGTVSARCQKSTTFLMNVTRLSPPPVFEERARERGYNGGVFHLMLVVRMFMTFLAVTGV